VFFVDVKLTVFAGRAAEFPRKYRLRTASGQAESLIPGAVAGIRGD
jgi:hypothetical protein